MRRSISLVVVGGLALVAMGCGSDATESAPVSVDGPWGVSRFAQRRTDCDRDIRVPAAAATCDLTVTQSGSRVHADGVCDGEAISLVGTLDVEGLARLSGTQVREADDCRIDIERVFEVPIGDVSSAPGSTTPDGFLVSRFAPGPGCSLSPRCSGGTNDGRACTTDDNCPDQPGVDVRCACPGGAATCDIGTARCDGGANNGLLCNSDDSCPDVEASEGFCDCLDGDCPVDSCTTLHGSTWTRR